MRKTTHISKWAALIAVFGVMAVSTAFAQNKYWDGSTAFWDAVGVWRLTSPTGAATTAPTASQSAYINSGHVTLNAADSGAANWLYIGNAAGQSATLAINGQLNSNRGYIGNATNSTGSVSVAGSWVADTTIHVGPQGTGYLTIQVGGFVKSTAQCYIGGGISTTGTGSVIVAGLLDFGSALTVCYHGEGTLIIETTGTVTGATGYVGRGVGAIGHASVAGLWDCSSSMNVGDEGNGTLIVTGTVKSNSGYIGSKGSGSGSVNVAGLWESSGPLVVGNEGAGYLIVEATGTVKNTTSQIGRYADSTGSASVAGLWENSSSLTVGNEGEGALTIETTGTVKNTIGIIGRYADSTGSVSVAGLWENSSSLYVGRLGTGVLDVETTGTVLVGSGTGTTGIGANGVLNNDGLLQSPVITSLNEDGNLIEPGLDIAQTGTFNNRSVIDLTHATVAQINNSGTIQLIGDGDGGKYYFGSMNHTGLFDFNSATPYRHAFIDGDLTGSGEFIMHTNIAANAKAGDQDIAAVNSDFITVIDTASGHHVIEILDRSNGGITGKEYALWLVETDQSESATTFSGTTKIAQGASLFTYKVMNGDDANDLLASKNAGYRVGDGGSDANNWYILLAASEIRDEVKTAVDSSLALNVMWFAEMDSLLKRMGQLRNTASYREEAYPVGKNDPKGGGKKGTMAIRVIPSERPLVEQIWVRGYGAQYNMKGSVSGSPFKQNLYGVDFGLDHAWQSDDLEDMYWLGLFGGYARAKQDYRYHGEAKGDSYYGGIYGTWLNDEGWYADVVGKVSFFDNGFDAWAADAKTTGDYNNWAAGLSVELGRQMKNEKGWFAEPQLQGSYVHFFGADYTAKGDSPFAVSASAADIFQLRYGSLFGRTYEGDEGDFWQPYVKVFGQHQLSSGGKVRIDDKAWRPNLDGMSLILGAGVIWQIDESNQLHLDYEAGFSRKYQKPWGVNFGYRHMF